MKVSRQQAQANREAVVNAASRLFREQGIAGTGVAEVTRQVGLTHGGFYAQFPGGKEDLAAEAIGRAFAQRRQIWQDLANDNSAEQTMRAIVETYLSSLHLQSLGDGCPIPILAGDASRADGPVKTAFSGGVRSFVAELEQHMPEPTAKERRASAARSLALMAGAMLLARSVDDTELANLFLEAARASQ